MKRTANQKRNWKLLSRKTLFRCPYGSVEQRVYENPHLKKRGAMPPYFIFSSARRGNVAVVAPTKENKVILLRQYRPAAGRWMINVVCGRVEGRKTPEETAKEELETETKRYPAKSFTVLTRSFMNAARFTDMSTLFLANGVHDVPQKRLTKGKEEEAEMGMEVFLEDFDEVIKFLSGKKAKLRHIRKDDLFDFISVAALFMAYERLNK